jgi:hypothetical protein
MADGLRTRFRGAPTRFTGGCVVRDVNGGAGPCLLVRRPTEVSKRASLMDHERHHCHWCGLSALGPSGEV